jgi:predicted dehydrogenase
MRLLKLLALGAAVSGLIPGAAVAADKDAPVQLLTLDPGHFHAALVQKFTLPGVVPDVLVFGPEGDDVSLHMKRIEGFNGRAENPTQWKTTVHQGADYLERLLEAGSASGKAGRVPVVVISGNNARKIEYIAKSIDRGFHVMADKPMIIVPDELPKLEAAFAAAKRKNVLLYDIMTERFEIATMLQKAFSQQSALFGTLEKGTPENPAISKISVHNFSKIVAGSQLKRPQWFFDPKQQGAGIVDVMTHLVDLVQWEAFPEVALSKSDAKVLHARRWTTALTLEQFGRVTGATEFPAYLAPYVKDGVLNAPANGEMTYTLKGVHARTSVTWDFEAPPGAGDTHYSVMRGTKASLIIQQGKDQNFKPTLSIQRARGNESADFPNTVRAAVAEVARTFPGVDIRIAGLDYVVVVPDKYHNGHEAHFGQVTENFLKYVRDGKLPAWEVANMIVKYATIMQAYEMSR